MYNFFWRFKYYLFAFTLVVFGFCLYQLTDAKIYFDSERIINELEGIISWHQKKIQKLTVILTGGDAEMLPKPFKNSIFAHSNFLAKGLNHILDMNTF